jgi:uncharacterized protein (DUF433 family)
MNSNVSHSDTERIVATPGICGGDWRILGTRVTVRVLTQSRKLGIDDSELLDDYPFLTADDLKAVWKFVAKR